MPRVKINGFTIHYQTVGEGRDVLLLHGLSGDLASWHHAVVARLASRYRVTRMDLRGHGRSGMPPEGYTTEDMAGDLLALMDHVGSHRANVVGHSFGGAVALNFAAIYPDRIASLTLADVRIRSLQGGKGVQQWAHWERVRGWLAEHGIKIEKHDGDADFGLLESLARCRVEGRLGGLSAKPFFIPFAAGSARRAEQWLKLSRETTAPEDYKKVAGLTRDRIRRVTAPTLAIYGALSHCLPTQKMLAGILPDIRTETVPGVGHFLPLAAPDDFADRVCHFLEEVGKRQAPARPEASLSPIRPRPAVGG